MCNRLRLASSRRVPNAAAQKPRSGQMSRPAPVMSTVKHRFSRQALPRAASRQRSMHLGRSICSVSCVTRSVQQPQLSGPHSSIGMPRRSHSPRRSRPNISNTASSNSNMPLRPARPNRRLKWSVSLDFASSRARPAGWIWSKSSHNSPSPGPRYRKPSSKRTRPAIRSSCCSQAHPTHWPRSCRPPLSPTNPQLPNVDPLEVLLTPAQVIERRPDVHAAELRLVSAAANSQIGVGATVSATDLGWPVRLGRHCRSAS